MMTYGTDRQGSVPPYSIARQFYSPHLYHASHFGLPPVGLGSAWLWWGELARLKRGYGKVALVWANNNLKVKTT